MAFCLGPECTFLERSFCLSSTIALATLCRHNNEHVVFHKIANLEIQRVRRAAQVRCSSRGEARFRSSSGSAAGCRTQATLHRFEALHIQYDTCTRITRATQRDGARSRPADSPARDPKHQQVLAKTCTRRRPEPDSRQSLCTPLCVGALAIMQVLRTQKARAVEPLPPALYRMAACTFTQILNGMLHPVLNTAHRCSTVSATSQLTPKGSTFNLCMSQRAFLEGRS